MDILFAASNDCIRITRDHWSLVFPQATVNICSIDDLPKDYILSKIYSSRRVILENNYDRDFEFAISTQKTLFLDECPFQTQGYIVDNIGFSARTSALNEMFPHDAITNIQHKKLTEFLRTFGLNRLEDKQKQPEFAYFIPSPLFCDAQKTASAIRSHAAKIDKIQVLVTFPEQTKKLASELAKEIGAEYQEKNYLDLKNAKFILSDYHKGIVQGIISNVVTFTNSPNLFSGTQVAFECLGDLSVLSKANRLSMNRTRGMYALYLLMKKVIHVENLYSIIGPQEPDSYRDMELRFIAEE